MPLPRPEADLPARIADRLLPVPGAGGDLEGAVFLPNDDLLFFDMNGHPILRLDCAGGIAAVATLDGGLIPAGIALGPDSRLYIADGTGGGYPLDDGRWRRPARHRSGERRLRVQRYAPPTVLSNLAPRQTTVTSSSSRTATSGGDAQRPMLNTPFASYGKPLISPLGVACSAPPWGFISTVDLAGGKLLWSKPLGSARDTGPLGMPSMMPVMIGRPLTGGAITTRGGLIFVGAVAENRLRALDLCAGRELWQERMPGGADAIPMT